MPFEYTNTCYPDAETARQAFNADFPKIQSGQALYLSSSTITNDGSLSASIVDAISNNTYTIQTMQLKPCSVVSENKTFDKTSLNDIVFIGLLVVTFIGGMLTGKYK